MKPMVSLMTLVVMLGSIDLVRAVVADGVVLPAGRYEVRVTDDEALPAAGQSRGAERWVEFLQGGRVMGREVASVITAADMVAITKGTRPVRNGTLVQTLAGGEYLRLWLTKDTVSYLLHLRAGWPQGPDLASASPR